jgi:eukaryotic-like serine/threonine-protein kinase
LPLRVSSIADTWWTNDGLPAMTEKLASLQEALGSRYRLLRELGSGGMATVYLAEDTERDEPVAVKVLRRELTVILGATHFHREIEILSRLQHPNIVPVLDSRQVGARLYYVMPFVPGDSLRTRLERQGPFPVVDVIRIVLDIAKAIDYAHEHGVLHRDIKPENVLLDGRRALVCDFGVARAIEVAGGEFSSSSGLVVGTPAYMSPEQATADRVDRRSDVYALGCVIYEMLTGEIPFAGPTVQAVLARKLSEPPRNLQTVRPDVPPAVERAVLLALNKDPAGRPGSAGALAALLT